MRAVSVRLGSPADQVLEDALDVTTRVRLAYVAAALAYAAVGAIFLVHSTAKLPLDARLTMAYLVVAPQLVILTWFISLSLRQRLSIFLAYALVGGAVALLLAGPTRTSLLVAALSGPFVFYPLVGLCFLLARRIQPFLVLLVASLLYILAGAITLGVIRPDLAAGMQGVYRGKPWLVAVGLANVVLGVILAGTLLKRRWAVRVIGTAALAVAVVAGSGLLLDDVPTVLSFLSGAAACVLQTLLVWLVFKLFVWFQELQRLLTPEILHAHLCWTYLTLYFLAWTLGEALFSDSGRLRWGLLLALALYLAVLHTLLFRIRAQRSRLPPKRLLLLRVFGRADTREDLLDALGDTWLRIGAVDLIAGSDVASRTLRSSMLEAFLLRRSDDQFLKTNADVDARLDYLRSEIEGDARYTVNGVYCYGNVWQRAFVRLAQESAAVLMDLRGFTSENRGCAWELAYLVQRTALRRIVLLVDRRTDLQALEQVVGEAWTHLPLESPNAHDPEPELKVLSFTRRSEAERRTLFELLLSAASDDSAAA